jgi:hypothetical protein
LIRILFIFGGLTALLWLADWLDTPDSVPAIKPLFWGCAALFAALVVRGLVDLARRAGGGTRPSGGDVP